MQIPVNLGAVVNEATNIEAARKTPLSVCIFMDETAPGDIQAFIRQAFASSSPYAQVSVAYFPSFPVAVSPDADIAVIVAGFDEGIAAYAAAIRGAGVPVMVVTTMPELVCAIAGIGEAALLEADLLSPAPPSEPSALAHATAAALEPFVLSPDNCESLRSRMGYWVFETCKEKRLAFALAFPFVRRPLSLETVNATSIQNAGVGLVMFIPGADMPIMTLNQAKMLLKIAAAYGQPMNLERAKELAVVVCGGFAFRSLARQAVAFVPALGWAIKAAIGYTGTFAMGHAAIEYFEGGGNIHGLVRVAGKAREKAVRGAASLCRQPNVKAAMKAIGGQAGKSFGLAVKQAVPMVGSAVGSAVGALSDTGIGLGKAAKDPAATGDSVASRPANG